MHPLEASLLFVSSSGSFSMMMVAQREDPPSTSFLRYASSCGRNPPPISFCVCTLALDWRKILQSGFAVTPREFFCLSRWLGAYAFYPQHIAFKPLVQCGSFPQGAAAFTAEAPICCQDPIPSFSTDLRKTAHQANRDTDAGETRRRGRTSQAR